MKKVYIKIEQWFEKLTELALKVYGNSLTFLLGCLLVVVYLANKKFYKQDYHDIIKDIIVCITFLSFFIIQKSINKFNAVMHLKMNELVATNDKASNRMVNIEQKSEEELQQLSEHYTKLAEIAIKAENIHSSHSIELVLKTAEEKTPEL